MLQNFGSILSILLVIWQDFVNVRQNEYTVHSLSTYYGLHSAYRIGVVEQCCQML